jgi:hypothetical protein
MTKKWKKPPRIKTYYVEIYAPAYPARAKTAYRVHIGNYNPRLLSPDLVSLWRVKGVKTKSETVAFLIRSFTCRIDTSKVLQIL